ncbi:response regulator [Polaromonas sp. CG_9.11]|uniref:response regulator n=1 Tax=Polaromonas sp. CG_9.11 TaxID=2787730 RepID=UPI0018C923D9|nr:response regulator [Polaromonas sp. CG_9.11]MBG6077311.1 DNA-binding NarL/FixJ family response regulator [Polaromonas sp. CG_9.11]
MALRVFLVEDSAAQCAYVTQILTAEAKVVIVGVAATEPLAVEWLDRHPDQWDIALVDLYLSEGTGVGVIRHCQNRRPGQSILVMTNHARNDHLLHHCERLGVDAVYHKATELESLVAYCKSMAARMPQCAA